MALVFKAIEAQNIKVISQRDDCLAHLNTAEHRKADTYGNYLKTLDESVLEMAEDAVPTYFELKTVATQKEILKQKNSMASMAMVAQKTGEMPIFSLMYGTVKASLVDMVTNGVSEMPKDKRGQPDESFMTWLISTDILSDLFAALEAQKENIGSVDSVKKKSEPLSSLTLPTMES